ncbi:hypothetical protein [Streptomyces sp. SID13031]|uniref:hypothetical protein n=1 Tax=Streptomyces sp. SID13031 TaxID=2706046 RepID=UPI0013CA3665|nr:hypothetical protein [Streptomyces sp. SID13031]NEA31004.1 hypothetical protein [Streptomyces sp. SID13031]
MSTRSSAIIGVVALAVSLTVSAPSVSSAAGPVTGRATGPAATGPSLEWISLVTGDQVAIDASGKLLAVRPAIGRERIRITIYGSGGHLYVVPADAAALVSKGVVDRRLFDVTLLARPEYRRQNAGGLAIIVTYNGHGAQAVRAADGVRVEHTYTSINGDGLRLGDPGSADAWQRLAGASGVKKVWLDAVPDSLYY